MAETLTIRTASSTEVVKIAVPGPQGPKGDKGDPGDVAGLPLTTQGDTLYRGASQNERLPIGTSGQVLKVSAGGIPEWGAAPSGVSSWNDLTDKPLTFPPSTHTHTASDVTDFNAAAAAAAPVQSVNGSTGAVTVNVPTASAATPQPLGTAAAGTSADFSRADHVHAMPSAADVGAAPASGIDPTAITGTAVVDNDARLSDSRTPTTHAASHAPASEKAIYMGIGNAESLATSVTIRAVTAGTAGNNIELNFDGVDSINTVIGAWNAANTSNTAELVSGNGSQVPDNGEQIVLSGGTDGGSDPLPYPEILASPSGVNKFKLGLGGDSPTGRFVGVTTASDPLIGILSYTNANAYNPLDEVVSSAFGMTLGANATNLFAQYLKDGALEAQYTFPATGGTLVVDGDLGTAAAADIGTGSTEVAAGDHGHGNINSSGLVGTTANLPLKTGTGGIVEAGVFGTGAGEFAEGNHTHADLHTRSHAITSTSDHTAGNHKVFYSDGSGQIQELALGNSGEVLTSNGATSAPSFAAASGGGVTTGSVDNAILRADGTGGSTSQSSDIVIDDATTSTQANVAIVNVHSETNSAIVLTPKGAGALIFGPKPAGTSTTGNARGAYAVDFGRVNFSATMIASGTSSAILGGENNTASGTYSCVAGGQSNTASGTRSFCAGFGNTASGVYSMAAGRSNTASGTNGATALGMGSVADRQSMLAFASGRPWSNNAGVAQNIIHVLHGKTTTNAAVELLAGDWNEGTTRLTVPSGRVMTGLLTIVGTKSDGATVASYMRQVTIKNVGGTTSLVGTVNTVGTDEAGGTSISITANDANDALKVEVTGVTSETWRWVCTANMTEMTYGS